MRVAAAALIGLLPICMSACGGGGGSSTQPPDSTQPPVPPEATIALEQSQIGLTVQSADIRPIAFVYVLVTNFPGGGLYIRGQYTADVIDDVDVGTSGVRIAVTVKLKRAGTVGPGAHTGIVNLVLCHDRECRDVIGSPLTATIDYTVDIPAGGPPVHVAARTALSHDVLDAEFSQALNSIVMVSAKPRAALYLYDVATTAERELSLSAPPKYVSVSRDGKKAAVAHDSLITYVDLQTVGQGTPPVTALLSLSADARDLVLGDEFVYAIPDGTWWVQMHSIEIATNTETSSGQIWPGSNAKLLADGQYFYAAHNLSPSDVEKWDVRSGVATRIGDSPYHGEHESCGNLWISEDGATIYTACGALFRSTSDPATDMRFIAELELPPLEGSWFRSVLTLSESAEKSEVMLVEAAKNPLISCDEVRVFDAECVSRLYFYDAVSHEKTGDFSLPPLTVGTDRYPQRGLFLFHDASGDGRYLVSFAAGLEDAEASYFVTTLQPPAAD